MPEAQGRFPVLLHPDLYRRLRESDKPGRAGVWKALRLLRDGRWGGGTRVKRLRGVARPVYEARTDSGDRLLFTLARSPRAASDDEADRIVPHLQVWDWVEHDDAVRTARRNRFPEAEFLELETVEEFKIDEPPPHPEATFAEVLAQAPAGAEEPLLQFLLPPEGLEAGSAEELGVRWYLLEPGALAAEEEFQRLLDEGGEELELKLSREQYEILRSPGPVLLAGSAGSGKTTVSIHRLAAAPSSALYLSYSPVLVEHARQLYRDLAAARGAQARQANFFTFGELYRWLAPPDAAESPEMTEELFREWFRRSGRSLDPALVWEELRSILKGACLDLDRPMLDEAAYIELGRKRAPLFVDERPEIYRVAQRYQEWLAQEGRYDRIDLCRRAFAELRNRREGRSRNWDVVVCDEVQDLTELEVAFVLALSRRPDLSGVLLTGDTQQIIQPSGFRWAEVKRLVAKGEHRREGRTRRETPEVMRLRKNLRSVRPLVELANALLLLRREVFGRTEEDEPEEAVLDGPVAIEVPADDEAVLAAIEGFGPRCGVLTTEEEAGRLHGRLGSSRVFAVREAKGLEFDTVILWKLLGPDQDLLERFSRGLPDARLDREPRFQRLLQHLYVAVTRARRHLAIHEGPEPHPFWGDGRFRGWLERETVEGLARLFRPTASPTEWDREGDYFLQRGHLRQAAECYRRAGRLEKEAEALARADEEREDWAGALARWTVLRRAERQAPLLERLGRLAEAAALYREAGLEPEARICEIRLLEARRSWKEAAAAWEELGRHSEAARAWERAGARRKASAASARSAEEAGEPAKAGTFWLEAGDPEAAARCFHAAGEPAKAALALARLHEEAKRWSRAAAAYRLAGERQSSARCRARALEEADRPGPAAAYRERLGEIDRAVDLYARAGRWMDVARLEKARPGDCRQLLAKVRELIDAGGLDEADRLLRTRREALRPGLPDLPGPLLAGAERLAWEELREVERLEHRSAALHAEAGEVWSRAARKWTLAWEPERAWQARRQGGRMAHWKPAPVSFVSTTLPDGHPDPGILRRLLDEKASAAEIRILVRHVMHGCLSCSREIENASRPPVPPLDDYDEALDRLHDKIARGELRGLAQEPRQPKDLQAELFDHPYVGMLLSLHSTRRAADLSLCEVLLRKSLELGLRDPERARKAVEVAAHLIEQLEDGLYGTPVLQDGRAMAWDRPTSKRQEEGEERLTGNARDRIRLLLAWNPDPPALAGLLTLEASLVGCRGRAEEAVRIFNRAASIHRRLGDRHLFGRIQLQKGLLLANSSPPRHAASLRLIRHSLDLIDPVREPRLIVCAVHNLIWFLSQAGRTAEAEACLGAARRLYERAGDRRQLGRLRWLEGKLAVRTRDAEWALVDARDTLSREGLGHEAALATLDLGALYARERKEADLRRLPDQVFSLSGSGGVVRDTTFLIEAAGKLANQEETASVIDELSAWSVRGRAEKNPPALGAAAAAPFVPSSRN